MNQVVLVGNLTKTPELIITGENSKLTKFTIAVSREYSVNADCDFFNVSAWGKLAEICETYLDKGNKVAVFGRLRNHSYEDTKGIKRTSTEIVAENIEFLSKKNIEIVERPQEELKRQRPVLTPVSDDDLPF